MVHSSHLFFKGALGFLIFTVVAGVGFASNLYAFTKMKPVRLEWDAYYEGFPTSKIYFTYHHRDDINLVRSLSGVSRPDSLKITVHPHDLVFKANGVRNPLLKLQLINLSSSEDHIVAEASEMDGFSGWATLKVDAKIDGPAVCGGKERSIMPTGRYRLLGTYSGNFTKVLDIDLRRPDFNSGGKCESIGVLAKPARAYADKTRIASVPVQLRYESKSEVDPLLYYANFPYYDGEPLGQDSRMRDGLRNEVGPETAQRVVRLSINPSLIAPFKSAWFQRGHKKYSQRFMQDGMKVLPIEMIMHSSSSAAVGPDSVHARTPGYYVVKFAESNTVVRKMGLNFVPRYMED